MTTSLPGAEPDIERLKYAYRDRRAGGGFWDFRTWGLLDAGVQFNEGQFRDMVVSTLRENGRDQKWIESASVIEVGCGWGRNLYIFHELGFSHGQIDGIDLMEHFVAHGREICPSLNINVGNGLSINKPEKSYDIVLFHTVFSSLLDTRLHGGLLSEALRVLKPGGLILIYDIVEGYRTSLLEDERGKIEYIRPVGQDTLSACAERIDLKPVKSVVLGLTPRIRTLVFNGVTSPIRRRLGFANRPRKSFLTRRAIASVLSLIPGLRSHFFLVLAPEGPADAGL